MEDLRRLALLRTLEARASAQGSAIVLGRRRLINFGSNDYLGLAAQRELVRAAGRAMREYGFGAGASRLLAGGTVLHEALEKSLAAWKKTEAALIFNSGYAANTGILPALAEEGDLIFSDALNHASIIDGCRLSRAKTVVYRHRDIAHLQSLLGKEKGRRRFIVTDSVFSMDGDLAPLPALADLCSRLNGGAGPATLLYIDDAHATGVLGGGQGALAEFGIRPEPWIVQMGTFSKALGSYGAFVAGSSDVIRWIANRARSLIFATALPPAVIAASAAALELLRKDRTLTGRLWEKRTFLKKALEGIGCEDRVSETPIMALRTGSNEEALRLSRHLLDCGIYAPAIRPPAVSDPRIRIVVTAAHRKTDLKRLVAALETAGKRGASAVRPRGVSRRDR